MVKSETRRDAETGILKSEPDTKKCSDLIEKHICDRHTQNLRLRDPLKSSARFRNLGRICRDSQFSEDHSPPLTYMRGILYSNGPVLCLRMKNITHTLVEAGKR